MEVRIQTLTIAPDDNVVLSFVEIDAPERSGTLTLPRPEVDKLKITIGCFAEVTIKRSRE